MAQTAAAIEGTGVTEVGNVIENTGDFAAVGEVVREPITEAVTDAIVEGHALHP